MKQSPTHLTALAILTLALASPAFADEAPATTQPAKTAESPTTLPATQPSEKPKPRHNDAPPRKNVPIVIKEAKDIWKLLPEDLRPGKDGKVSDELAEKIKAWAKENKGKFEQKVQFVATENKKDEKGYDAIIRVDGPPKVRIKAPITAPADKLKIKDTKYNSTQQVLLPECVGVAEDIQITGSGDGIGLSILLKNVSLVKITFSPNTRH